VSTSYEFIEVTTTTANEQDALAIARLLVAQRLAACVQVTGPIRSCYRWQGEVCEATEVRLTVKSLATAQDRIIQAIQAAHSYDTPEIIVTAVLECSTDYGQWLREQVQ